jgi:hypothetical protein
MTAINQEHQSQYQSFGRKKIPEVGLCKYVGHEIYGRWQTIFASTAKILGYPDIVLTVPGVKKAHHAVTAHYARAKQENVQDQENKQEGEVPEELGPYPTRAPTARPTVEHDQDGRKIWDDWIKTEL